MGTNDVRQSGPASQERMHANNAMTQIEIFIFTSGKGGSATGMAGGAGASLFFGDKNN